MRPSCSLALTAAAATLPAMLTVALPAAAAPRHGSATPAVSRQLIYLTAGDRIEQVTVSPRGVAGTPTRIAPDPGTPARNRPAFVTVSADGTRLAWTEGRDSRRPMLYLRNLVTGTTTAVATNDTPAGFAGHTLLVTFNKTFRLVLRPKPHFVYVPRAGVAMNGYSHGAIDVRYSRNADDGTLRLTTFAGKNTPLHRYTDFATPTYRTVDASYISPDQRRLVVERGNHQDFDGLGPASLVDEFSLTGHHHRSQLGHFGSDRQVWRISTVTFRGRSDEPYAAWEAETRHGVPAVVARWSHGRWHRVAGDTITVAADTRGDLLLQPGRYLRPHSRHNPTDYPMAYPSASATLRIGRTNHRLVGVRGIAFWFVAG